MSAPRNAPWPRCARELDYISVNKIIKDGLHEYLDGLQARMNTIDDNLTRDFFAGESDSETSVEEEASSSRAYK